MTETRLTVRTAQTEPDYRTTAGMLLTACRNFYTDPQNEAAFLEWKKNGKKENR